MADADALLGACDEKNCSYTAGYVGRQALYACETCSPETDAGICLACSYACHEGHKLYEIYTKRNFRCDCGNSKFGDNKCSLFPTKAAVNEKNRYSQNFKGLYCTCRRPYPDPENTDPEEMIQCCVCEDWFHREHIGLEDVDEDFEELTCRDCMQRLEFLWRYQKNVTVKETNEEKELDAEKTESEIPPAKRQKLEETESSNEHSEENVPSECTSSTCLFEALPTTTSKMRGALWPKGWRSSLCKCTNCIRRYSTLECEFVTEEGDSLAAYEAKGFERNKDSKDKLMTTLGGLNRVALIETLHGYNNMKTELIDFLRNVTTEKKVVTEKDIKDFFEGIKSKTKPRSFSSAS